MNFLKKSLAFFLSSALVITLVTVPITGAMFLGGAGKGNGFFTPKQNVIEVCKQGCKYDTIQEGMDAIVGGSLFNPYVLLVYPGAYPENVVCVDGVVLQSIGLGSVVINPSSGIGIDCSVPFSVVKDIAVVMNPTVSGAIGYFDNVAGLNTMSNVRISVSSSTPGVTGTVLESSSASLILSTLFLEYNMTGTSAGVNTHEPIVLSGAGENRGNAIVFTSEIADVDDNIVYIVDNTTGSLNLQGVVFDGNMSHATPSGTADFIKSNFAGEDKQIRGSSIVMSGGGTSTKNAFNIDSGGNSAVLNSTGNTVIFNGTGTNNFSIVDVTDELISEADPITGADTFSVGGGITTFKNSQASGKLFQSASETLAIGVVNQWHAVHFLELSSTVENDVSLFAGTSGSFTSVSDGGGGEITVASAGHSLLPGDNITLTSLLSYNGIYEVQSVVDSVSFNVIETFVASGIGSYARGTGVEIFKKGSYTQSASLSVSALSNNTEFEFAMFNGVTIIEGSNLPITFGVQNDTRAVPIFTGDEANVGDKIWLGIRNLDDATDIDVNSGSLFTDKNS